MSKKCLGCGSELQNTDINALGYVKNLSFDRCERCFRQDNYNETVEVTLKYSNDDILNKINNFKGLVFFLVDFITLTDEVFSTYHKINDPKILIVNKSDIIFRYIKKESIRKFIKEKYNVLEDIIFVSSLNNKNIEHIKNIVLENKKVCFAGYSNVGKSTFLKKLAKLFSKDLLLTTSNTINTTTDFIEFEIGKTLCMDTPGFNFNNKSLTNKLLKKANPKKVIKPIIIQAKDNDIISIGDEIFINVLKKCNLVFYMSNSLVIKKIYNKNIHFMTEVNITDECDLILKGVGFINIKSKTKVKLNISSNDILVRDSMLGWGK